MTALIPFLAAILGALVYALASNPKVCELGRLTFFAGVLLLVYVYAGHAIHLP